MPTYDYECQSCHHIYEVFQSITDKPLRKCPECGGKVTRLIGTGAGIIFKGSGFYETDYKRNNTVTASAGGKSSSSADNKNTSSDNSTSNKKKSTKKEKK